MENPEHPRPDWLDDFEELANENLSEGSACRQIHPIMESWYERLMNGAPPESRDSVLQAMACLSTEILFDIPDNLLEAITVGGGDNDELVSWVQEILMIGRAFQLALDNGSLDDL